MKKKQNTTNAASMVCEPQATYNDVAERKQILPKTNNDNSEVRLSVDEYFDKLWALVEEKYENLQS